MLNRNWSLGISKGSGDPFSNRFQGFWSTKEYDRSCKRFISRRPMQRKTGLLLNSKCLGKIAGEAKEGLTLRVWDLGRTTGS